MPATKNKGAVLAGGSSGGSSQPASLGTYNSFTIYEEFDRALADVFTGSMLGVTTGTTAASGMTATFTTAAIQNDPPGVNGAMTYNCSANQAAGSVLRYVMHGNSPGRMQSMFRNGFKAEIRFMLEVDMPTRAVNFGWFARAAGPDANGSPTAAGSLILGQTVYLIRRDPDAGIVRKDELATLAVGKVYTLSVDTTSGQLVHVITNNTDGVEVSRVTVPKWTGWRDMAGEMDLFGSAPSNVKFSVFFGVAGGVGAVTATAGKVLTLDAFFVHCPKLR